MILVELVPRDRSEVVTQAEEVLSQFKDVTGFNIPDVMRLSTRSYHSASDFLERNITVIPHIRSIDMPLEESLKMVGELVEKGLKQILVVTGDAPISFEKKTYPVKSTQLISAIKLAYPTLQVFAALDPYRVSFQKELDYCEDKIRAGVDGFFTQPFFDIRLAEIYVDQLSKPLFLGVSPVLTEKSKNYWVTRNKVIFPSSFELTVEYNVGLAKDMIELANEKHQHNYLMPIKVDPTYFLSAVFNT